MMKLLRVLDKVTGHVFVPGSSLAQRSVIGDERSDGMGMRDLDLGDVDDVQDRWVDRRDEFDEMETDAWRREGEMRAQVREE